MQKLYILNVAICALALVFIADIDSFETSSSKEVGQLGPEDFERDAEGQQCPHWKVNETETFSVRGQTVTCICLRHSGRFSSYKWYQWTNCTSINSTTTTPDTTTANAGL